MCTPSASAATTVRQTPLTARLSPLAQLARRATCARRSRDAARSSASTSVTSPMASISPVNIALDHHVVCRAQRRGRRSRSPLDDGRRSSHGTPAAPSDCRRHEHLHAIDQRRPSQAACVKRRPALEHQRRHAELRQPRQRRARGSASDVVRRDELDLAPAWRSRSALRRASARRRLRYHHYYRPGARGSTAAAPPAASAAAGRTRRGSAGGPVGAAGGQQRVVGEHRPGADRDGVDFGALAMDEAVGGRPGQLHAVPARAGRRSRRG